jgi:hypothetical protein
MKMSHQVALCTVVLGLGLAGCATTPPSPAVTQITGKSCTEKPDLSKAISLTPKRKEKWTDINTPVDSTTACMIVDSVQSNYLVYALPAVPSNHTLTVGSQYEALRLMEPMVTILNGEGQTIRSFPRDRLANIGSTLGVQFRPSDDARYILVQINAANVGTESRTFETELLTQNNTYISPTGYASGYQTSSGQERTYVRKFSHEGMITVRVQAVKGKIGLPNEK